MLSYIARRVAASTLVLFLVSVIVFLMVRAAPGDVILSKIRQRVSPEELEVLRGRLGLEDPLYQQYWDWLSGILTLDFGNSLYREHESVLGRILDGLPVTVELIVIALATSVLIGVPVGIIAAVKQNSFVDLVARIFSVTGLALPLFWLGTLAIVYGTKWFGYTASFVYVPIWEDPVANLKQFWLPGVLLGYNLSSITMRVVRSSVLGVMRQDFIRTARAKGLAEHIVVGRHVLKNAMIPVMTILGNQIVFLLGGTLIVEFLFHLPGLGFAAFEAISVRDYTMIQGIVLFLGAMAIAVNLLVDTTYAWLDPRIKYA
ncbi:MAG: ABC transporter permease [Dehalococcoidia bacterium]